ncbi:MAG: fibro-slime domain-containing protein [Phycisphaerae bacterium]|jgi:fibro-slime domain-containing protein
MNQFVKSAFIIAGLISVAGMAGNPAHVQARRAADPYASLPSSLQLTAVIRDFKGNYQSGGHPDFERNAPGGNGICGKTVEDTLDADGKPVFLTSGYRIVTPWRDASGRGIMDPRPYIEARAGDRAGSMQATVSGALAGPTQFAQWYRDVSGVNLSKPVQLMLNRTANTNMYTFSSAIDPTYSARRGFFPINGDLFGNSDLGCGYANTNYHFTTEIDTEFMFERGKGQIFTFIGDDDVWVFIDGKLVVDMGGLHCAETRCIELDRLTWLTDGGTYRLKVFHAERHRTESNFRIDTNLRLKMVELPPVGGMFD